MSDLTHSNDHPGLMAEFIGEDYPFSVRAEGTDKEGEIVWRVVHLLDGWASRFVWGSCVGAHDSCQEVAKYERARSAALNHGDL